MVRDFYPRLAELAAEREADHGLAHAVGALTPRVYELSEFLVDRLGVEDVGPTSPTA